MGTQGKSSPTAKVFMHGRSQAVRLPKDFRVAGDEVRVSKSGGKVILEPMTPAPFDIDAWRERLDALGAEDFLPEGVPEPRPLGPGDDVSFD